MTLPAPALECAVDYWPVQPQRPSSYFHPAWLSPLTLSTCIYIHQCHVVRMHNVEFKPRCDVAEISGRKLLSPLSWITVDLWHCSLAGLFWATLFEVGGGLWLCPTLPRAFISTVSHWKTPTPSPDITLPRCFPTQNFLSFYCHSCS